MPGDLVSMVGNPAEWAGDFIALGALVNSIRPGRRQRAEEFARNLEELTGYTAEQIGETLRKLDDLAELVASALDSASRAVDERKRQLLARAAAAQIAGDEDVLVDDLPLFVRTLDQIDVPHMKLLVLIGEGTRVIQGLDVTGGWDHETICRAWPGVTGSLEPLVSVLNSTGLIQDTSVGSSYNYFGGGAQWNVTSYGERFTRFVRTGAPTIIPDTKSWPVVG